MDTLQEYIKQNLVDRFLYPDLTDCFLVDIQISQQYQKIQVFVDCDSGMSLKKCEIINRFLGEKLDQWDLNHNNYVLEVSSPGVDRPLESLRQYKKNIGRKVELKTHDHGSFKGKIVRVEGNQIILEKPLSKKEVKKTGNIYEEIHIDFNNIKLAIIKISFK